MTRRKDVVKRNDRYTTVDHRIRSVQDSRVVIPRERVDATVSSRGEVDLPPRLLTVKDLAALLSTSRSGVYSRVARGQIPGALRLGRTLRFDPRVIAQWLSANSASAGGHP